MKFLTLKNFDRQLVLYIIFNLIVCFIFTGLRTIHVYNEINFLLKDYTEEVKEFIMATTYINDEFDTFVNLYKSELTSAFLLFSLNVVDTLFLVKIKNDEKYLILINLMITNILFLFISICLIEIMNVDYYSTHINLTILFIVLFMGYYFGIFLNKIKNKIFREI